MGKRSSFERRAADFYPTPRAAVLPLIPFLRGIRTFAEPCAGEGDLVRNLESFGLRCVYQGDIRTGQDALALTAADCNGADCGITNPPYTRDLMHRLIVHFQNILPFTWLLLDSDWAQTKQSAPFLPSCSDIVPIGRVKWIEDSRFTGKDNHAWYRFDSRHTAGPVFHWRDQRPEIHTRRTGVCEKCGKRYELQRASARFCSPACKQQAYRKRLSVTSSVTPVPSSGTPIEQKDSEQVFRYLPHHNVARFEAEGWEALPALEGTHHAEHAVLMRRRVEQRIEQQDDDRLPLIG